MHSPRAAENLHTPVGVLPGLVQWLVCLTSLLLGVHREQFSYQYALCNPRGAPF